MRLSSPATMTITTALACGLACSMLSCGSRLTVLGKDDQPAVPTTNAPPAPAARPEGSLDLPNDEGFVEPEHPAAATPLERAVVHVHTPSDVCSGGILGPRVVVTAQRCLGALTKAQGALPDTLYVEIASSTLTWTKRNVARILVPACGAEKVDIAVLVLAEAAPWVTPLRVMTSPEPGGRVRALGYGKCRGETRAFSERTGQVLERDDAALIVDLEMCHGDIGGPLVEQGKELDLLGLVSHDRDGTASRSTTIARLDTTPARALVAQANAVAKGEDPTKLAPVSCP